MAPKRATTTKKLSLKAKATPKPISAEQANASLQLASSYSASASLDIEKMLNESSASDLQELDEFLRRGKTNTPFKLESFAKFLTNVKKIENLRDWLDDTLRKVCDNLHDQAINKFGGSPDDFDFEEMKGYISQKLGVKMSDAEL
eukprot:s1305_g21.t1